MRKTIVFADIHINTSKYPDYEKRKLNLIVMEIKKYKDIKQIVFAGDIFDKNRPSLQDIQFFYEFIEEFDDEYSIEIIAGNHDHSVFEYLPHTNFTYYNEITVENEIVFIPWSKIHEDFPKGKMCYSHARCTIPPHIVEEVDMAKFSSTYKLSVLGDIHQPLELDGNIVYTSSPVPIHFKSLQKNSTGYLIVDEDTCTVERHFINDIAKVRIDTNAFKLGDTIAALKKKPNGSLYKVVVEDYPEKLLGIQKWATQSIKIEPKIIIRKDDVSERVKQVLDQSLTIEEILYNYLHHNFTGYSIDLETELRKNINA